MEHKHKKNIPLKFLLALVLFFAGYFFPKNILPTNIGLALEKIGFNGQEDALYQKVVQTMEEKYPFQEPTDNEKLHGSISGFVSSYKDNYSVFLPPVQNEFFAQTISGEFGGIGAEIGIRGGYLMVIAPLKGSPAELAGLKSGDIVININGTDVVGEQLDAAIGRIRGELGTEVVLTIIREGREAEFDITITRELVKIPIIDTETIDNVFVIHLYNFNDLVREDFKDAISVFKKSGKKKLLIDLRNNPGGYLGAAVDISSYFIEQGDIILREEMGEGIDEEVYRSTGHADIQNIRDLDIRVLINKGSASASEILAGALQDHGKAEILGEQSFGKGSVQELIDLPGGSALKVTVAKWLTPDGDQISEKGITPDIEIIANPESTEDQQLLDAIASFTN